MARVGEDADRNVAARIEGAATRLFILHGYNGVSYLNIAREIGMTHSSIHYYYRTKAVLAEAVLRRVAESTLGAMKAIWTDSGTDLLDKFVGTRNWIFAQYLLSNPAGKGSRPWGLLWRLSMDADSLPSGMKRFLRASVDKLEDYIACGVTSARSGRELVADSPVDGITLQIATLMSATGQVTRHSAGFERLDSLMRHTFFGIMRAYGSTGTGSRPRPWPAIPDPATVQQDEYQRGRRAIPA
jgi:AcrR family transcriptional regulator